MTQQHRSKKKAQESNSINIDSIFIKIAPYLEHPEFIKKFLKLNSKNTKTNIIESIEKEIKKSDKTKQTDLRILLNSIQ